MKYLSVGTNEIYQETFLSVTNRKNGKPNGGIWATQQFMDMLAYNEWIDYLSINPSTLFYKYSSNPFNIPAVLITLKPDANIITIDSKEKLDFVKQNYPDENNWIDFEKMGKDFDAIYFDIYSTLTRIPSKDNQIISKFGVSSLIITNIGCIDYYQSAIVKIDSFDYYGGRVKDFFYQILIDSEVKYIEPNPFIEHVLDSIKEYIKSQNLEPNIETILAYLNEYFANTIDNSLQNILVRNVLN